MRFFTSIFIFLLLLSGCSSKPSVELISSSVEISDERLGKVGFISDEGKGDKILIQPISLSYYFVLKNTGKKTLGGMKKPNPEEYKFDDAIEIHLEPNKKLQAITEEVMGFNIFEGDIRQQAGKSSTPVIEPNQEGEYTIDFDLGTLEENPLTSIAPSSEQLEMLKESSMDATLVISIEGEEITRINLNNSN